MKIENITIIGSGYVGLALAISLSSKYHICVHDIDEKKVKKLNQGQSPLDDNEFLKEFKNNNPQIFATTSIGDALKNTQLILFVFQQILMSKKVVLIHRHWRMS